MTILDLITLIDSLEKELDQNFDHRVNILHRLDEAFLTDEEREGLDNRYQELLDREKLVRTELLPKYRVELRREILHILGCDPPEHQ